MSAACPVAVRIVRRGRLYRVIARGGRVVGDYPTFDEAWSVSVPYFAGLSL